MSDAPGLARRLLNMRRDFPHADLNQVLVDVIGRRLEDVAVEIAAALCATPSVSPAPQGEVEAVAKAFYEYVGNLTKPYEAWDALKEEQREEVRSAVRFVDSELTRLRALGEKK